MSFGTPIVLWGLVLIPLAVVLYALAQRRRMRYAVRFTNLDLLANVVTKIPRWRRHLPPVLLLLALSSLLVGLARPQASVLVPK
jgi:Ca-activated chloride channel homolog